MRNGKVMALILAVLILLTACGEKTRENAIDSAVLTCWEGTYSKENRADAIAEYEMRYIPVFAVNIDGDTVSFAIDFDGVSCGSVTLAPVDADTKNGELNTVVDFTTEASVEGNLVTVDISWWHETTIAQGNTLWSYLFWVKDAEGVNHYYYFRVDYSVIS